MYVICDDYSNSRHVNYNRWSSHKEVDQLVEELVSFVDVRKKVGYARNIKVLILDLFQSYITDHEQYIAYHRSSDHYKFKFKSGVDDRYISNPNITMNFFVGSVDLLLRLKLISHKVGAHFYNKELGEYGFLSRMRATSKLIAMWDQYGLTWEMIEKFKDDEVIILKDVPVEINTGKRKRKIKTIISYKDTPETNRMRQVIKEYNRLLDHAHIDLDAECLSEADRAEILNDLAAYKNEPVIRVNLSNKNVYRVFNNRSFNQGGRFYGSWWTGCPSILRKYITINGDPTVELDYSGIHIHLLYAMKGINYAAKKEDPYLLDDGLPDRELNKLILLTALNAVSETGARDSVYDQLRRSGKLSIYNLTNKEPITRKINLLKEKHSPIAEYIASDFGIKLQYYDSSIIEKVITYGMKNKIPILTVHDSVVVQKQHADRIKDKMWEYFTELVNVKLNASVRYNPIKPHTRQVLQDQLVRKVSTPLVFHYMADNELYKRIRPTRGLLEHWIRQSELITIKSDIRNNTCSGSCTHATRVSNYRSNKRNYLSKVKVRYIKQDNREVLNIGYGRSQ